MVRRIVYLLTTLLLFIGISGCSSSSSPRDHATEEQQSDENEDSEQKDCEFSDDTYSATVDYHNPATSYSATYTLDVEVEDCKVTVIHFPNDGYLNDDHITPEQIDDDGDAMIHGEEGKTYRIHIEN